MQRGARHCRAPVACEQSMCRYSCTATVSIRIAGRAPRHRRGDSSGVVGVLPSAGRCAGGCVDRVARRSRRIAGYNASGMKTVAETGKARWEQETLEPTLKKSPERAAQFTTISGRPIERLYTAEDLDGIDPDRDIALPGAFPYTRRIHPNGYRGKLWAMRQVAG